MDVGGRAMSGTIAEKRSLYLINEQSLPRFFGYLSTRLTKYEDKIAFGLSFYFQPALSINNTASLLYLPNKLKLRLSALNVPQLFKIGLLSIFSFIEYS
jgi:hypothetical protein